MKDRFFSYLLERMYTEKTSRDYARRVAIVCEKEGLSWKEFINDINKIVCDYDWGGKKSGGCSQANDFATFMCYKIT